MAELKKAVRKVAKGRLAALAPDAKSKQSAAVAEALCASPHFVEATSVAVYLSMAEEVDTDAIIRRVFESGKRCYVPRSVMHTTAQSPRMKLPFCHATTFKFQRLLCWRTARLWKLSQRVSNEE